MNWKLILIAGVIVIGVLYYFFFQPKTESDFDTISSFFEKRGIEPFTIDDSVSNDDLMEIKADLQNFSPLTSSSRNFALILTAKIDVIQALKMKDEVEIEIENKVKFCDKVPLMENSLNYSDEISEKVKEYNAQLTLFEKENETDYEKLKESIARINIQKVLENIEEERETVINLRQLCQELQLV
ncbi:MAG TPA: hypothetical protein VJK05_01395 [archaeon]|nr:hypothetical protein [archaeon]